MRDTDKTKQELIQELKAFRAQMQADVPKQASSSEHALLDVVSNISTIILSHTSLNDLLDALTQEIISTNLFRSLAIVLVDHDNQNIQTVRRIHANQPLNKETFTLPLHTKNIVGVVVNNNQMEVIEGWDDRFAIDTSLSKATHEQSHKDKVSYFIPISQNEKVIAILATGSTLKQKQQTLERIEMLKPIMEQLAVAFRYAHLNQQAHQQAIQLAAQVEAQQQEIEEKQQSLNAFQKIDQTLLNTLDIDQLLDALINHIHISKYFRSLLIALVDHQSQTVKGVRDVQQAMGGVNYKNDPLATYQLSDIHKVIPLTVKTGQMQVVESPDDPRLDTPITPEEWSNKVAFFIPVNFENQTLAVLATGCHQDQKDITLKRIDRLKPFINHMAIALKHAQMRQASQEHALIQEATLQINQAVHQITSKRDLTKALKTCLLAIQKIQPSICALSFLHLIDEDKNIIEAFRIDKNGAMPNIPERTIRPKFKQRWKNAEKKHPQDISTWPDAKLKDYRSYFNDLPIQSRLDLPFSSGILVVLSTKKAPFNTTEKKVLDSLNDTLSLGLARLENLTYLQEHSQKQDALLQVSRAVQNMILPSDLQDVFHTIFDLLNQTHLPFASLSIHHIIDASTAKVSTYRRTTSDKSMMLTNHNQGIVSDWENAKIIYRPNIEQDLMGLPEDYAEKLYQNQGIHLRSMLNVPFKQGVLVLRSEQVAAFSKQDIQFIEQIAQTLSLGIARADDLREKEAQFQEVENVYKHTPIGLFTLDQNLRLLRFNEKLAEMNGLTQADLGRTLYDIIPDQIQDRASVFQHVFDSGEPIINVSISGFSPAEPNKPRTWLANYFPFKSQTGEVHRLLGAVIDITDLKEAEEALRQNTNLLNQAQSMAHLGSWTLDLQTHDVCLSEELCKIYGIDISESTTTFERTLEIVHPDDRQMIIDHTKEFAETGIAENNEFRIMRPNGDIAYLYGQAQVVTNTKGQVTGLMGTVQDITERKQMETENQRSQRLRALGEMAAGLSHNLNNILTGILGPAQLLLKTPQTPRNQEEINAIINAGKRAGDIVQRLNQGWRQDTETLEATHINHVIEEAIQASRPRWKDEPESRGITIVIHKHLQEIPPICGTQAGLFDILINLVFNAVDAMPTGGHISFTTTQTPEHIRLLVSDTGTGMPEDVIERIFDPFFTTKQDIGTGLGLATAYGTIHRWGGNIDVKSTLNQGTTFTLDFPIWEKDITPQQTQPALTPTNKVGRILIVEDEEIVARVLKRALSDHHVETRATSQSALKHFKPNTYDILITDLGLPNIPGDQLASQLRQQDPSLITVLISGWELLPNDPRRAQFDFFVQKPFYDFDVFQAIIKESLETKNGSKRNS